MHGALGAVLLLLPALPVRADFSPAAYYGDYDGRKDLFELTDTLQTLIARSSLAIFEAKDVKLEGGQAKLSGATYGRHYGLCRSEPFYDQPSGAQCSGVLIGFDTILTAGHCILSQRHCQAHKFVFGYGLEKMGADSGRVPTEDVFSCKRVIARRNVKNGADWALIQLDRFVESRGPVSIDQAPVQVGDPLFIVGHPSGLPTKIAGGGWVTKVRESLEFQAALDTNKGNSGSGVFNAHTGKLVGVLVGGDAPDFVRRGSCNVSYHCSPGDRHCGEEVTRVSTIRFPRALRSSLSEELSASLSRRLENFVWP